MELVLERRDQRDETVIFGQGVGAATPLIDEDYWAYRVRLGDTQAIVGFPKFGTIGIGFAQEEDWNSNLPFRYPAEEILAHIGHNKGSSAISAAGTWAAADYMGGERACWICGFAPSGSKKRLRPDPFSVLLELDGPDPGDPLLRSRLRCRNRKACDVRASA